MKTVASYKTELGALKTINISLKMNESGEQSCNQLKINISQRLENAFQETRIWNVTREELLELANNIKNLAICLPSHDKQ